jgi:hypothetical protein
MISGLCNCSEGLAQPLQFFFEFEVVFEFVAAACFFFLGGRL